MKTTTALLLSVLLLSGSKKDYFSAKSIENRMVKVEEGLFANKYETSNAEYREFLEWAKANKPESLSKYEVNHTGWDMYLTPEYSANYFNNTGFDKSPVVNITHEAALAFCDWLTLKYNESGAKKKKFQKVKFRLPTEKEWIAMALNGKEYGPKYPWGGPYLRNRKGEYLAQFRRYSNASIKADINNPMDVEISRQEETERERMLAGALMMAWVDSYMPTGAGLHHLAGNAAEMLAEPGRTKGGSWASSGYYLQINAEDEFEGFTTSPYVGFRYVMEVVEE